LVDLFDLALVRKAIILAGFIFLLFCNLAHPAAYAQNDEPQTGNDASQSRGEGSQSATANLSGTVLDTNRDVVQGATISLVGQSGSELRSAQSGSNGQFVFTGLPAGVYKIIVTQPGMNRFISTELSLHEGEFRMLPPTTLSVAGSITTVTVSGDKEKRAEEQVQIAVQQRVAGVIPNFYSTFDWNAPPMGAKQKFHLSFRSIIDPVSFLAVAAIAGAEQYNNVFPDYGGGWEGYGKRYGAALATHVSSDLLGKAVYPSIFHQDPRYFYKGKGSFRSRALYAISTTVIAKGDDGRWEPNYSSLLGNFSAAAISNLYVPASDRGFSPGRIQWTGGRRRGCCDESDPRVRSERNHEARSQWRERPAIASGQSDFSQRRLGVRGLKSLQRCTLNVIRIIS